MGRGAGEREMQRGDRRRMKRGSARALRNAEARAGGRGGPGSTGEESEFPPPPQGEGVTCVLVTATRCVKNAPPPGRVQRRRGEERCEGRLGAASDGEENTSPPCSAHQIRPSCVSMLAEEAVVPSSCSTKSASWAPCIAELRVVKAEAEPTRAASMHARAIAPARPDERSRARAVSALPRVWGTRAPTIHSPTRNNCSQCTGQKKQARARKKRACRFLFCVNSYKTRRLHKKAVAMIRFCDVFHKDSPRRALLLGTFSLHHQKPTLVPLCSPCDSPLYFPKGRAESAAAVVALARRAGAEGFAMGRRCCFVLAALAPAVQGFTTIQQTAYGAIP